MLSAGGGWRGVAIAEVVDLFGRVVVKDVVALDTGDVLTAGGVMAPSVQGV
jgi:hypothetical protein